MLEIGRSVLLVIDVQGRLAEAVSESEALTAAIGRAVRGARALGIPILCTEQIPAKLGATRPEIAGLLEGVERIPKSAFSCCGEPAFERALEASGRSQVLVCGIEAHVCVYQTAMDLRAAGYEVEVLADAVSSRCPENRRIALDRMARAGVGVTSVEMALFELQRVAEGPAFKALLGIVK
jgi:nicotinamidase-related amidase